MAAPHPFVLSLDETAIPLALESPVAEICLGSLHFGAYHRVRDLEQLGGNGENWPELLAPLSGMPSEPALQALILDNRRWPDGLKPRVAGRMLGYLLVEAYNQ